MADENVDPGDGQDNPDLEAQRPDWLPQNFNDPADLAKSWKEAQSTLTRTQQELAAERRARENYEQLLADQQQESQQARQNDNLAAYDQAIVSAFEEGDYARALVLQRQLDDARAQAVLNAVEQKFTTPTQPSDPILADLAVDQRLTASYPDWGSYKERVLGWAKENVPNYDSLSATEKVKLADYAYRYVKFDDLQNVVQQAPDTTAAKLAAQSMSGAGVRQPTADEQAAAWERIASAPGGSYADLMSRGR